MNFHTERIPFIRVLFCVIWFFNLRISGNSNSNNIHACCMYSTACHFLSWLKHSSDFPCHFSSNSFIENQNLAVKLMRSHLNTADRRICTEKEGTMWTIWPWCISPLDVIKIELSLCSISEWREHKKVEINRNDEKSVAHSSVKSMKKFLNQTKRTKQEAQASQYNQPLREEN